MSQTMYMFDDTNISLDPAGAWAYAGYVDGAYANFSALAARFPKAHLLPITVLGGRADACDVENGDMTNADVYNWFKAMVADGIWRPCVYTAAGNMKAMQETMAANGFPRSSYRMWSAHYTGQAHFCAPNTCGYGLDQADATQFTDQALGKSLDESIVADDFFPVAPSLNPVKGLHEIHRGWTSFTLAWQSEAATSYTVKVYEQPDTVNKLIRNETVTTAAIRIGDLSHGVTYRAEIRAHPGGSVGANASINVTTRGGTN